MNYDIDKYDNFVILLQKDVYNYVNYHLKIRHIHNPNFYTDEITDDIFIVMYKKWEKIGHLNENEMRAWIYDVAKKEVLNWLRKNKNYLKNIILSEGCASKGDTIDNDINKYNFEKYIWHINKNLDEEQKKIFNYYILEEKNITEISKLLNIPHSTVRYKIKNIKEIAKKTIIDIDQNAIF